MSAESLSPVLEQLQQLSTIQRHIPHSPLSLLCQVRENNPHCVTIGTWVWGLVWLKKEAISSH